MHAHLSSPRAIACPFTIVNLQSLGCRSKELLDKEREEVRLLPARRRVAVAVAVRRLARGLQPRQHERLQWSQALCERLALRVDELPRHLQRSW